MVKTSLPSPKKKKKAGGRKEAAFDDIKYLSQEGEWFLAGLLEGMPDGTYPLLKLESVHMLANELINVT